MGKDFVLFVLAVTFGLSGAAIVGVPSEYNVLSEIDNLSDASSDILPPVQVISADTKEEEVSQEVEVPKEEEVTQGENESKEEVVPQEENESKEEDPPVFEDPKVYGMNIGLHFLLERISVKIIKEERVHLESLIKVLVLTHQIEKVGGTVNDCNMMALKRVAVLYPKALKEAIQDS